MLVKTRRYLQYEWHHYRGQVSCLTPRFGDLANSASANPVIGCYGGTGFPAEVTFSDFLITDH